MDEVNKSGTYASYETYKEAFDAEVKRTELGFVRIGTCSGWPRIRTS